MVWVLVCWIGSLLLGAGMLSRYNKAGIGFLLGLFLGPLGLLFALLIRSNASKKEAKKLHDEQLQAIKTIGANQAIELDSHHNNRQERECPFCAELILGKAKVCKHCGRDIEQTEKVNSITYNAEEINLYNVNGLTPLMEAVKKMDVELVAELIRQGANPEIMDEGFGTSTALDIATILFNRTESTEEKKACQEMIALLAEK